MFRSNLRKYNPNKRENISIRLLHIQMLLAADKLADIMVIGTQDAYHVAPAIASIRAPASSAARATSRA